MVVTREGRGEGGDFKRLSAETGCGRIAYVLYLDHKVNRLVCTSYQLLYRCVADGTLEGEEIWRGVLGGETLGQKTTWKASEKSEG